MTETGHNLTVRSDSDLGVIDQGGESLELIALGAREQTPPTPVARLPLELQKKIKDAVLPEIGAGRARAPHTSHSLRRQLICAFVPVVVVTFVVVILAAGLGLFVAKQKVVSYSRDALQSQVAGSTAAFVRDAGQAFENQLLEGVTGCLLPMAHSYADVTGLRPWPYSLLPPPSFVDTNQTIPGVPALVPTQFDPRRNILVSSGSGVLFTDQLTHLAELWVRYAKEVNQTAHIDRHIASFFRTNLEWYAAYIGTTTKMLRYFPGILTDKEATNFDPTVRPWFSGANTLALRLPKTNPVEQRTTFDRIYITEPYLSYSNGKFMITLAQALYLPDADCRRMGMTICRSSITNDSWMGVAGVDVLISTTRRLIEPLKAKQRGQAHLFSSASGIVVASPQWWSDNTSLTMHMSSVTTIGGNMFSKDILSRMTGNTGTLIDGDALIVYTTLIQGRYTLTMVTSVSDIVAPIDVRLNEISTSADELLGIAIGVGIFFMLIVTIVVFVVAALIVQPIQEMARDSSKVSVSIGAGIEPQFDTDLSKIYVGEVNQLRVRFQNMLKGYRLKREEKEKFIGPNPFFGSTLLPSTIMMGDPLQQHAQNLLAQQATKSLSVAPLIALDEPPPLTRCNRMKTVLRNCVLVPLFAGLSILVIIVAVKLHANSIDWVHPVREAMITQEKNALPVRVTILHLAVSSLFRRAACSFEQYHEKTQDVWNAAHAHVPSQLTESLLDPYPVFYVPHSVVTATSTNFPGFLGQLPVGGLDFDPRFPNVDELVANIQTSHFFQNGNSGYKNESGYKIPDFVNALPGSLQLQTDMSHLQNFARVIYFSNNQIVALYFGEEKYEGFQHYPYRSGEFYPLWEGLCLATGLPRIGYTPVCRPWYVIAKQNQYENNWTPVYLDATTGFVMISVSRAVHDANGTFVGVACMDVSVSALNAQLKKATLYTNGYVYVVDREGLAVLHPRVNLADTKLSQLADLELACGNREERDHFVNTLQNKITNSTSTLPDQASYMRCGETWYASWASIENTPYVLVITLPLSDITLKADELARSLNNTLGAMIGGWIAIAVVAFLISMCVSGRLARGFASSLEGLAQYLKVAHSSHYVEDFPTTLVFPSYELEVIEDSIRDLLVTLRMGNSSFSGGSMEKELLNYFFALEIVTRNKFPLAIGYVHERIGHLCRLCGMYTKAREHTESSIAFALFQAKENYKDKRSMDTLAQRYFNLALLELSEKNYDAMARIFQDVFALHRLTKNGTLMTRSAYALLTFFTTSTISKDAHLDLDVKPSDSVCAIPSQPPPAVLKWMETFAREGLLLLSPDDSSSACVAMGCLCLGVATKQYLWCVWGLRNIPDLSVFLLCHLARYACEESSQTCDVVDPIMERQSNVIWDRFESRKGEGEEKLEEPRARVFTVHFPTPKLRHENGRPRNFLFCLDVSEAMNGTRLEQCRGAVSKLVSEHCRRSDYISLVLFGTTARSTFPLQKFSPLLWNDIRNMTAGGQSAFFDALGLSLLQLTPRSELDRTSFLDEESEDFVSASWVIVLMAQGDNASKTMSLENVVALLEPKRGCPVHLMVITVGKVSAISLQHIRELCRAAREGGGEGVHLEARNSDAIPLAFQQVAQLMQETP